MRILSKYLFIPLLESRTNGATLRRLKELKRTQWFSEDEIIHLQQKRLQSLIAHAYENVPYYHRVFQERGLIPNDIKTVEDLNKLPVLTRQDIKDQSEQLIASNYDRKKMRFKLTGGSTGEPLRFAKPKDEGWGVGAWYRGFAWYGLEPGDKWANIEGGQMSESFTFKLLFGLGRFLRRQIFFSAFDLSERQMEKFAGRLRSFQPKVITGYPSAIYILAEYIQHQGIQDIKPKAIITNSEKLYDHQRQIINEVFGCDVFDQYGCQEVLSIAYECPEHKGLHITTENVVLEIINNNGQPASHDEPGRIVVTDLHNYAMPFIRYDNGDLGVTSDVHCSCGRALPMLKSVLGRTTDTIVTPEGKSIPGIIFPFLFLKYDKGKGIKQFQVRQEAIDSLEIMIVKGNDYSNVAFDCTINAINEYTNGTMKIDIRFVNSISPTKAGKRRLVISNISENTM